MRRLSIINARGSRGTPRTTQRSKKGRQGSRSKNMLQVTLAFWTFFLFNTLIQGSSVLNITKRTANLRVAYATYKK